MGVQARCVSPKLPNSIKCGAAAMETRNFDERQLAAPRVSIVEVTRQPGEPLGVMPGEGLQIVHVQGLGLVPGDRIVSVNGRIVRDEAVLRRALEAGSAAAQRDGRPFVTVIGIQRAAPAKVAPKSGYQLGPPGVGTATAQDKPTHMMPLSKSSERLVQKRSGFVYFTTQIKWTQEAPSLGLQIRDWCNRVLVVRTERGSLAEARLHPCDRLVAINGTPVSDKEIAKELLLRSLANYGRVLLVIERPVTPDAYASVMQSAAEFAAQVLNPRQDGSSEKKGPSVNLPSDVREIGQRAVAQLQETAAPPPILKPDPDTPSKNVNADRRNIQLKNKPQEVKIRADHDPAKLRRVPKL